MARTPWLALVNLPMAAHVEADQRYLRKWLEDNPGEHPERRAIVETLHTEMERIRGELATAQWILDQAIYFKPMEDAHGYD